MNFLFQGPTGVSGPKGARGAQGAPVSITFSNFQSAQHKVLSNGNTHHIEPAALLHLNNFKAYRSIRCSISGTAIVSMFFTTQGTDRAVINN